MGAVIGFLGSLTAAQIGAGAAVLGAGVSAATAMKGAPKAPKATALMPSQQVAKLDEETGIEVGSERGAKRKSRETGRQSLMAPTGGAPKPNTAASGVKV